jgi:cobyrinic acid a,c-diamide synthase
MSRRSALQALGVTTAPQELAIVEGSFRAAHSQLPASSLKTLCDWLDLPQIGIVDVSRLTSCVLPAELRQLDGLLLDRTGDASSVAHWQTTLEALTGAPVLGWLGEVESLRKHCSSSPSRELCRSLADELLASLDVEKLLGLACRPPPLAVESDEQFSTGGQRRFRIGIAYDEAYCGYYPETLDLLEAAGAELCDFSPLKSGAVPPGVDIVYFGCGHPEQYSDQLAANHCLKQSLRCFAAAGGRIYAEGSGLAYLCREMVFPSGATVAMTGLLPATARWLPHSAESEPTEVVFGATSWLVPSRTTLRGYRHSGWQIEPRGPMITYARDAGQRLDVLGRGNVIGSRVLFNLAANRHLLRQFFEPYAPVASSVWGDAL